jgi:hypothetical protein
MCTQAVFCHEVRLRFDLAVPTGSAGGLAGTRRMVLLETQPCVGPPRRTGNSIQKEKAPAGVGRGHPDHHSQLAANGDSGSSSSCVNFAFVCSSFASGGSVMMVGRVIRGVVVHHPAIRGGDRTHSSISVCVMRTLLESQSLARVGGSRSFEMRIWTQEKRQVAGFLVVWKVGIEFRNFV